MIFITRARALFRFMCPLRARFEQTARAVVIIVIIYNNTPSEVSIRTATKSVSCAKTKHKKKKKMNESKRNDENFIIVLHASILL